MSDTIQFTTPSTCRKHLWKTFFAKKKTKALGATDTISGYTIRYYRYSLFLVGFVISLPLCANSNKYRLQYSNTSRISDKIYLRYALDAGIRIGRCAIPDRAGKELHLELGYR